MKRALITGITGFVGSHLAEFLLDKGYDVCGTVRWRSDMQNILHIKEKLGLVEADLNDPHSLITALKKVRPDEIYHLAAQSFVPTSWTAPADTMMTNAVGTIHLYEAVKQAKINPVIQVACSSEEYGLVKPDEIPIKETNPLRPLSPYGVSKVAEDMISYQYTQSYGMKIVITRGFNHSVSEHIPVIVRDTKTGFIDIKIIRDIRKAREKNGFQKWKLPNLEIWSNNKFSKIHWMSSHPFKGKLLRLVSSDGIVEITNNHSVIGENDKEVEAGKLKIGSKIKLVDLPTSNKTKIDKEIAWFYGLFVAEGDCTERKIRISNLNKKLLERAKEIMLKHFGKDSSIYKEKSTYRLSVLQAKSLCPLFKELFYSKEGFKKIPPLILNTSNDSKLAFLEGYNEGDGLLKDKTTYKFKSFTTKSPVLAMGLYYLSNTLLTQKICMNYTQKQKVYRINLNTDKNFGLHRGGKHFIKKGNVIKQIQKFDYKGFVYDFETEDHTFHAGIGKNLVHNTGPRRGEVFVTSNFAKQIVEIEKGKKGPVIEVGNLESKRDFTDVRDMVRGYWLAVQKGKPGERYNLCSGKAISMQELLDMLLSLSNVKITVKQDPLRMRPSDVLILQGDNSKAKQELGWRPEIPFEKTLKDLMEYWRERVK